MYVKGGEHAWRSGDKKASPAIGDQEPEVGPRKCGELTRLKSYMRVARGKLVSERVGFMSAS